jgi:hypothetical protein
LPRVLLTKPAREVTLLMPKQSDKIMRKTTLGLGHGPRRLLYAVGESYRDHLQKIELRGDGV